MVRGRKSVLVLALIGAAAIPAGVAGQGVPIGDFKRIALEVLGLREEAAKQAEVLIDAQARAAFFDTVRRFDATGQRIWRQLRAMPAFSPVGAAPRARSH